MLKIDLYKCNNEESKYYGKVYGRVSNAKPIDEVGLAKYMHNHYTTFSVGELCGMIKDMAKSIKELILVGQPVQLTDLAIFKATIESKPAVDALSYDLKDHVRNVKLSMMSTGESRRQYLNDEAVLEFSTYSQKVRAGEIQLADKKADDDEPMVNP